MSTFYTCVDRYSNDILFRGYKNGKPIKDRIRYNPTFYVPGNNSKFKTLDGKSVEPIMPGTMRDCRQFLDEYKDVGNFKVHGNANYIHQFISDAFLERGVEPDRDLVNVTSIDIEVQSDKGFPQPDKAEHPITAITIKNNIDNMFYVWGLSDWEAEKSELKKEIIDNKIQLNK